MSSQVHTVRLNTTDGQQLEVSCPSDENIIAAAERADIYLNAQCKAGTCGSCCARVQAGSFRLDSCSADALPEGMEAQGDVLLCRTYPRSDLEVALPYAHGLVRFSKPPLRTGEVVALDWLTPDTARLRVQLAPDGDGGEAFLFEPGQFAQLRVKEGEICRPYSLANAPGWDGALEFLIKLRKGGAFSEWLRSTCTAGCAVEVEGPYGTFALKDNGLRPRVFVAGGCGLASVVSMVRQMAEFQEPHPCRVLFGVWREEEVFYQSELAELVQELPNATVTTTVENPSPSWAGARGSVVDALAALLNGQEEAADVYVCGSPGLVSRVKGLAAQLGLPESLVHYEGYGAATPG